MLAEKGGDKSSADAPSPVKIEKPSLREQADVRTTPAKQQHDDDDNNNSNNNTGRCSVKSLAFLGWGKYIPGEEEVRETGKQGYPPEAFRGAFIPALSQRVGRGTARWRRTSVNPRLQCFGELIRALPGSR